MMTTLSSLAAQQVVVRSSVCVAKSPLHHLILKIEFYLSLVALSSHNFNATLIYVVKVDKNCQTPNTPKLRIIGSLWAKYISDQLFLTTNGQLWGKLFPCNIMAALYLCIHTLSGVTICMTNPGACILLKELLVKLPQLNTSNIIGYIEICGYHEKARFPNKSQLYFRRLD